VALREGGGTLLSAAAPILARNLIGDEVELTVVERAGLIAIQTSESSVLILAPQHAIELLLDLLECIHKLRRGADVGPLSSTM
jgi:hypothetical protein